jgi:hypothetical protein
VQEAQEQEQIWKEGSADALAEVGLLTQAMANDVLLEIQTAARTGLFQIALAHALEELEGHQAFVPEVGEQF